MGGIVTDKDIAETMRKLAERQAQDSAKMPAPVEMHKFASGAKSTVVMPRFDLIPLEALILLAERFGYGASRHGERNYRNGANDPEFIRDRKNHMFRHVVLFMEHNRPEDLGAVLCNAAILADIGAHKTDGDETLRKEAR